MARQKDNDPVRTFVENLTECSMCFEEMEQPKFLQCGHSFCLKCIRKQCEATNQRNRVSTNIVCALCRKSTTIPRTGLGTLPSSFVIEDAKGCLKIAEDLGLTKVRLPICEKSNHQKDLNLWCETCMELICIICCDQKLHHMHTLHHVTFTEAFQKYRDQKYRYGKKIAEMEKAYTNLELAQSQCQKKSESLVSEIDSLKKEKKKIVKREKTEQKKHKNVIKKHLTETSSLIDEIKSIELERDGIAERAERDRESSKKALKEKQDLQHRFEIKIESLVDRIESIELEKDEIAERSQEREAQITSIYQKGIEKVQSDQQELQDRLEIEIELLVDRNKSIELEKSKIAESSQEREAQITLIYLKGIEKLQYEKQELQHKFEIETESLVDRTKSIELEKGKIAKRSQQREAQITSNYQKGIEKVQSDKQELQDKFQNRIKSLVYENESLQTEKNKIIERANRRYKMITREFHEERRTRVVLYQKERKSLELENRESMERERILKRDQRVLLFILSIIIASIVYYCIV
ncbi:uncharacterized protein [Antedon mediterranea]|uniref:uncharacterized protein n=1 Tax=Antedon mediterranea TaxID=105859 RepID=UPI003AF4B9A2